MDYFLNIDFNDLRITVLAAFLFDEAFIPAWERRSQNRMPVIGTSPK